jgi:hypothetical protein
MPAAGMPVDASADQPLRSIGTGFSVARPTYFARWQFVSTRALTLALGVVGGLAFLGCPAAAQQFSADVVTTGAIGWAGGAAGKLYVSNGAVRIETPNLPASFFVVNGDTGTAYLVRPAQHIFMDAKQSSRLTQVLVPVAPDDPCKQWQAMAIVAGVANQAGQWHCRRLGQDNVAGHHVVKYQVTSPLGQADNSWIDPRLKFPVRFQFQDGTRVELDNIRKGPQPAELFEIPSNLRKFDPRQLIEHIKQSDVWVDPPK